ncbi:RCC1 domain-containing protein, alpha-tubulin suppressor [Frankia canadensis]|uniref:RCC1 domain-containing protein, alpha-tubulin suppressor n=1 Tax=Frankia canadensis TaxID=1836972 RepID=A0A2I2KXV6_9ACTN|nr:RCC1 repeat-containing protein [Frankia canadensis]SNQ50495.1 RCC1 domain-containing protein, alpha-tubulin suppressor [Frankia canadensis]SOU57785.1 RCC1 domain-containing protein, alpha-tubulin suppressor [Frankia canadensis]
MFRRRRLGPGTLALAAAGILALPTAAAAATAATTPPDTATGPHRLAAASGTEWSWGYNGLGALGNGTTTNSAVPVRVSGLTGLDRVVGVAAGRYSGYAVRADGTPWSWGYNAYGQLGDGTTMNRTLPVRISGLTQVSALAGGSVNGYALRQNGTVWAWGYNTYGQLGNGTTTTSSRVPVQVGGLDRIIAIASGGQTGYALRGDGTVWAWGYNDEGQLGDGTTTDSSVPVQVAGLSGIRAIAGGQENGYALGWDGMVRAWGENDHGQLGNDTTTASSTPVVVPGLTQVTAIAASSEGNTGYALRRDATLWAWGLGNTGQLGNGDDESSLVPVQVNGGTGLVGVTAISAGSFSGYALRWDGTAWAWGSNYYGQLGNGTTMPPYSLSPVQVSGTVKAEAIAGGGFSGYSLLGTWGS